MVDNAGLLHQIENPRVQGLARYQDLDAFVSKVFSDGFVSSMELTVLKQIDDVLDSEYQVAQGIISKMEPSSPMYMVAKEMLNYLYRCRNLMDAAADKAKIYNELQEAERRLMEIRERQKETLDLKLCSDGLALMQDLMTPQKRMQAEQSFSAKAMRALDPAEKEAISERLFHVMQTMRETHLNAFQMNKMLCLGREL